jgi:hypothetical protein
MPTVLLVARGVLLLALLAVVPVVILRALVRRASRGRRFAMSRNVVARRPLEDVAADLRRLDRQFALVPTGATLVRWRALWAAYDRVLMEAAEQLEVAHTLPDMPIGVARDIERLRVVSALEACGLVVRG